MFEVVILTVTPEFTQNELDTLLPLVTSDKQKRIHRFHFFRDARNCLLGDILARIEICCFTDLNINQIEFLVNEYGKLFVVDKPRIHFNISHAGNYVAIYQNAEAICHVCSTIQGPPFVKIISTIELVKAVIYDKNTTL